MDFKNDWNAQISEMVYDTDECFWKNCNLTANQKQNFVKCIHSV